MGKRGRHSSNVIPISSGRRRIEPPSDLTPIEARTFREVVANCPSSQFVESDIPLLVSFCQATLLSRKAAKALASDPGALIVWDRAVKVQAMLAMRLRLAPSSRSDPKVLARRVAAHRPSAYDTMDLDDAG